MLPALLLCRVAEGLPGDQTDELELAHFEEKVRPLLAEQCVQCHGPEKQKGGLRLDSISGMLHGGDGGRVLEAGDAEGSRLIQAVRYLDADLQMPPRSQLNSQSIADLERWVAGGLHVPDHSADELPLDSFNYEERLQHWSFSDVEMPDLPLVKRSAWPRGSVDQFLLARMEANGLSPAADAPAIDWLRRVNFALVGLPPTPEMVRRFRADSGSQAQEQLVDELLDSPQFGERWGRHWLDLVRYAETRGHEFDFPIPNAWQYRDYVVRAFNADVPYDRFVREHVAGDLLPTPRLNPELGFDESLLGTGFWFFGDGAHSPVDIRSDETDRVSNQVDVFSRAFLGLTVACARCHDHKFDPLTSEDYYALSGFVMGGSYRQARFQTLRSEEEAGRELRRLQEQHQTALRRTLALALEQSIERNTALLGAAVELEQGDGEAGTPVDEAGLPRESLNVWVEELRAARANPLHPLHTWLVSGDLGRAQGPSAESLNALFDRSASGEAILLQDGHSAGIGALPAGTLLLRDSPEGAALGLLEYDAVHFDPFWNRLVLAAGVEGEPTATDGIIPGRMFRTPTFEVQKDSLEVLVRGKGFLYGAVDSHRIVRGPLHAALCRSFDTGDEFRWIKMNLGDYVGHRAHLEISPQGGSALSVAGVRHSVPKADSSAAHAVDLAGAPTRVLVDGVGGQWERALVDWMLRRPDFFPLDHPEYLAASEDYSRELNTLTTRQTWVSQTAPVMLEGSGVDEFVLLRGSASTPGPVAHRRFLEALGGKGGDRIENGSGRLELARQLTSPSNPFLARVWTNRLWHYVFGTGLVASVDDFGVMGSAPSHPELLDYLASTLVLDGWSTKTMLRRLVLSRAFGMSSSVDPAAQATDPNNRLLQHMPVQRLDAESLRDSILAVSGTLDATLFGPSVPVHLTPFQHGRGRPSVTGPLDGAGRRSLYLSVRRNFPVPFLGVFDFPNPATTMGRRGNSNVPAQALTLLNDAFVHGESRRWAERVLASSETDSDPARIASLYRTAFARSPTEAEQGAALGFIQSRGDLESEALSAWTDLCHVLFNTKEFRFLK
ncbi:MAG: hypothetical protein ACI9K5_000030 [Gammaproteobacteria bacterium]|jgi:hypothetical protein